MAKWQLSVGALDEIGDQVWAYTIDDDAEPVDLDTEPVQLQDDAKLSWEWLDYPSTMRPATATFRLRVRSAADLPDVSPGQNAFAFLTRPGTGAMICAVYGVLDDPDVEQDSRGLVLSLVITDPLAQLAEIPVDAELDGSGNAIPWPAENLFARLSRIAQRARINLYTRAAYDTAASLGIVTPNNKAALTMLNECLSGAVSGGDQLVLRAGAVGFGFNAAGMDTLIQGDPALGSYKPAYFVDRVSRYSAMQAPFVAQLATNVLPGQPTGPKVPIRTAKADPYLLTGGAVLDAVDVLRASVKWTKAREAAVNQLKLVGLDSLGAEKSVLASYDDLVKADGPNARVVDTQLLLGAGAPALAAAMLPDRATARPSWTAETFTVWTDAMSDAEFDAYAPKFWPDQFPGPFHTMQLPVAVVNVDAVAQVAGGDLSGVLVGATFQLVRGKLSIVGQLRAEVLRPDSSLSGILTWSQLRTELVDGGGGVAWSAFTWHPALAPPASYTSAAVTFDAAAADPSFDRTNLTWRDLRLMGVS